jgi:hypothetical protein
MELFMIIMIAMMMLMMVVMMAVRTGQRLDPSAARLAFMSAAVFPQGDAPPQIAGQLEELLRQRHGLVHICQEISQCAFAHGDIL